MRLYAEHWNLKIVAAEMGLARRSVAGYADSARETLGARTLGEAVLMTTRQPT